MAEFFSAIGKLFLLCLLGLAFHRATFRYEFSFMAWWGKNSEYPPPGGAMPIRKKIAPNNYCYA